MAPLKTYSSLNNTSRMKRSLYNSVAEPTFKKRKVSRKKIAIPDLPPPSTVCQLSDNSLKVMGEDSFDRLLKTSNHNSIHFKSKSVSSSDSSYDIDRYRTLEVKKPIYEFVNYEHFTDTKKKGKTTQKNEKTYSALNKEKSSGTSIESSLEIEVIRKGKPLIDSSLGLTNSSMNLQKSINNSTTFEPVLCKSFQNIPAMCSTPIEPEKQKFINQTISPITNNLADSLILSKAVPGTHESSDAATPIPKLKPDGFNKPVNVEISGGKTNRRISYITIRKRKIYFTPVALLTKRRFHRLSDNSSNSNNTNNDPSNSEQNQKTSKENSRPLSLHSEVTDIIENSLDNGLQHLKKNSLKKSFPIIGKTEPKIEMQTNSDYIALRNRKVSNNSSNKSRKALSFGNSDTPEGQNTGQSVYKYVSKNSKENKSSSIFSTESSCNGDSLSKTDFTNARSNIQQIENSSACYESTNLERSHKHVQNNRFEEVSLSIESVNTTENTNPNNFCEDASSKVENTVSILECEEDRASLIPINSNNVALNTHEDTLDLDSIKCRSFKSQYCNLQQSASVVYGESMCDSNIEGNYVNVRRSKRNFQNKSTNIFSSLEMTTGNSENNLENDFSEKKETVSQFEEPENVTVNSITSVLPPMEVIVNVGRSDAEEDTVNFSSDLNDTDSDSNEENSVGDINKQGSTTRLSASVEELEESSQYSTSLNSPANKKTVSQFEKLENVYVNSGLLPLEVIINIKRSDTINEMVKNYFNLEDLNDTGTDVENSLDNRNKQRPSTEFCSSIIELEESSKYSNSLKSDVIPKLTPEIKGSNALKNVLIKNSFNLEEEEESLITDSFKSLHLNNENGKEPSSVIEVKEKSEFINFIMKHQPVVDIRRSNTIEKLLNANSTVEKQTSKRQSDFNEPFRGFDCDFVQQQSLESTPSHHGINNAAPEDFQSSNNHTMENVDDFIFALPHTPLKLKPGKPYRRSLLQIRNSTGHFSPANTSFKTIASPFQERSACISRTGGICTCTMCKRQSLEHLPPKRVSVRFMPVSPSTEKSSTLQNYAAGLCKGYNSDVFQESLLENYFENLSLTRENLEVTLEGPCREPTVTAKEIVLRRCGQTEPLPFEKCYPNSLLQHCHKIGEGVYGEVFLFRNQNAGTTVMKIIPIEGDQIINGEKQKKFDEIISEIIIAMELSNLRNGKKNNTTGFNELYKICCVQGKYPERLLELWELYEEGHGTENDSPEIFPEDQLYIVLELANGGKDLEAFVFNNAQQAYAIFIQTACAIAVAETALQFEHRDLHWGNILISNCDRSKKKVRCCIDGEEIQLPTFGVEVAIIDFTLSRITHDGVCIYNDLSLDADLFTAKGDYQFDIYRLMKSSNGDQWQRFQPYTNVLWLHYTLDKMITAVRYKNKKTRMHKEYLVKLEFLKQEILEYKSVKDIVKSKFTMASAL